MPNPRSSEPRELPTPSGPARVVVRRARHPVATLVLGHGAGAPVARSPDLMALLATLPDGGVTVVGVDQPWVVAGRKVAVAPPKLDEAWLAVLAGLAVETPLLVGGRSAGARVACRTAARLGAVGSVCLAFPLHPPGRPERSRAAELLGAGVPVLVCQGEADPFGRPADFPAGCCDVRPVPGDHGLKAPAAHAMIAVAVLAWISELLGAEPDSALEARRN